MMKHREQKWMRTFTLAFILLSAVALSLSACSTSTGIEPLAPKNGETNHDGALEESSHRSVQELVVYSTRKESFVQPLLDQFTAETGIKVKALHGGDTMINQIKEERNRVQADILISNDIGALEHLRIEGMLQGLDQVEGIESIAPQFRAEDNSWIGLSARTRIFMYNPALISEEEMPKTMWDLTDEKYKGKFAITNGGNASMVAQISALRSVWGDEKTKEWLEKISTNAGAVMKGHGEMRQAIGAGEYAFGLVNNYYYHLQLREPTNNQVAAIYPDQGEGEMGAFVNGAGVAVIKDGPHSDAALQFVGWLLKPENQKAFSYHSLEVPLNAAIEAAPEAKHISEYRVMEMHLSELGPMWEETRQLIEEVGFDLLLR